MTEEIEIIKLAQAGDEKAFTELVRRHQKDVHMLALRLVRNREEALDVSQTVFIQAYKGLSKFKGESSFSTWLYRITYNTAIRRMQSGWWRKILPLNEESAENYLSGGNPEKETEKDNFRLCVEEAISNLPTQMRAVFTMHQVQGLKMTEVAEIIGKSEGNVKALHYHAVRKLREALKEWKHTEFA